MSQVALTLGRRMAGRDLQRRHVVTTTTGTDDYKGRQTGRATYPIGRIGTRGPGDEDPATQLRPGTPQEHTVNHSDRELRTHWVTCSDRVTWRHRSRRVDLDVAYKKGVSPGEPEGTR